MPDTIRMRSGGPRAGTRFGGFVRTTAILAAIMGPAPALADDPAYQTLLDLYSTAFAALERHEIAALALTLGVVCFAVVTAIALVRTRARAGRMEAAARADIIALRDAADRANALLLAEPQIIIAWPASGEEPDIIGDTSIVTPAPVPRRVLAFGTWLDPEHAQAMEQSVEVLRSHGNGFATAMPTLSGRYVEAEGRAIGGRAILRIKDVSGIKHDLVEL